MRYPFPSPTSPPQPLNELGKVEREKGKKARRSANTKGAFYSELAREKMWSRIYLTPLLQAEEDRDQIRRHIADRVRESQLTGESTRVYYSDRYVCLA